MGRKVAEQLPKLTDDIGGRLKYLRIKRNVAQDVVAEKMCVDRTTYTYYETGKRKPTADAVKAAAQFFGVSTDFLFGLTDIENVDLSIAEVCMQTGLNEKTINLLHFFKDFHLSNTRNHTELGARAGTFTVPSLIDTIVEEFHDEFFATGEIFEAFDTTFLGTLLEFLAYRILPKSRPTKKALTDGEKAIFEYEDKEEKDYHDIVYAYRIQQAALRLKEKLPPPPTAEELKTKLRNDAERLIKRFGGKIVKMDNKGEK